MPRKSRRGLAEKQDKQLIEIESRTSLDVHFKIKAIVSNLNNQARANNVNNLTLSDWDKINRNSENQSEKCVVNMWSAVQKT